MRYIYQNELDEPCFQHDMACGTFKDFIEILKAADQVLRDEAFSINKDPKYDVYQRERDSAVHKCFDKKRLVAI